MVAGTRSDRAIELFGDDLDVLKAKAAEIGVERRILRAPFSGVVLKVKKHVGEWVAAGEPIVELIRVDRLDDRYWKPRFAGARRVLGESGGARQ